MPFARDTSHMIDTTKWRVTLTENQFNQITKLSREYSGYDNEKQVQIFRSINKDFSIGSYSNNISIKCFEDFSASLEFSVPKQHGGNNVELLYPSQLEQALAGVHRRLVDHLGDFPPYKEWQLDRLDLCYGWRYHSQAAAEEVLKIIKTFDYPRKSKYLYKESVIWRGRKLSIKFYLKRNEFLKHDFSKLKRERYQDFAYKVLELSNGVLRYEITIRKEALCYLFEKKRVTYIDLLSNSFLERILDQYLKGLTLNLDRTVMQDKDVVRVLKESYSKQKAMRLFTFYKLYSSPKLNHRQILKDHYHPSTIWRNKRDIALANVGLPSSKPVIFDLDIPSKLVVNPDPIGTLR